MKSANNLAMERSSKLVHEADNAAIKSILFAVHDDDNLDNRLQAALSLARACSAHLQLLHVVPIQAYTVVDTYGGTFASGEIVKALEEEAAKLGIRIEGQLSKEDVSWNYDSTTSSAIPELIQAAAFADLKVIGRYPSWHDFGRTGPSLVGELLCSMRTPLCVPGDKAKTLDPFGKAVIAWKGSAESAAAVRSAIGLLRMASEVRVVRYVEDGEDLGFPDVRLLQYLSRFAPFLLLQHHRILRRKPAHRPRHIQLTADLLSPMPFHLYQHSPLSTPFTQGLQQRSQQYFLNLRLVGIRHFLQQGLRLFAT